MDKWQELLLFPLNTVLFPGMVLPLHIFEERYKQMIHLCLKGNRPFGVVLIREGKEVGGGAVPYTVGTTAMIAGFDQLQNGRMNIIAIGSERFRLHTLYDDKPLLSASAEQWPLTGEDTPRAWQAAEQVRALFPQYLDLLARAQGNELAIEEIPTEPRALTLLVAVALRLPMEQKQSLLNRSTIPEMLQAEHRILLRETAILEQIARTQEEQWEGGHSGLLARN